MKWFNLILRLILGGIFVYAGVLKIIDPAGFAKNIGNYQLLPHNWINALAITLPWIEVLAGGLLVAGRWRRASALVIAGMLVVFLIAIASAVQRGLNIDCGCFGTVAGRGIGLKALVEDVVMLVAASWLIYREKEL